MTISIIPANPGFYAVVTSGKVKRHLPVIAWRITDVNKILERVDVDAIGLDGMFHPDCVIIGPDGQVAHE